MLNTFRHTILLLLLSFALHVGAQGQGSAPAPVSADTILHGPYIHAEETLYEFGEISRTKEPQQSHPFLLTNKGDSLLVIKHIATSCGCTTATCDSLTISPRQSTTLNVHFDATKQRIGPFNKSLTIYCNDPRGYIRLKIHGIITE